MRWWIFAALVACSSRTPATGHTGGSGSNPPPVGGCDGIRGKVEALYRADAQVKEPKRVEAAVADNTTMVMNDCAKAPDKVATCVAAASTVADLERTCLRPLDDEGNEGLELRK